MITKKERNTIVRNAKEFDVKEIYLFGSSLDSDEYRDIDIGVKGVPDKFYYKFGGKLMMSLTKPVDIIDLDQINSFTSLIIRDGKKIYG